MLALLTTFHVLVALVLILIVLIQSAKGTDVAAAFGGMGSQTAFGPRGTATFLSKATVVLAIIFMVTSLSLAILSSQPQGVGGGSVLGDQPAAAAPTPGTSPGVQVTPEPAPEPGTAPPIQVQTVPATPGAAPAPASRAPTAPAPATTPNSPGSAPAPAPQSSGQ